MSNQNIQGVIPFKGSGYRKRTTTPYQAGELRDATNVMFIDDVIKVRPRITPIDLTDNAAYLPTVHCFLDTFGEGVKPLARNKTHLFSGNATSYHNNFSTYLAVPAAAKSFHVPVAKFRYNDLYYWLSWEWNASTGLNRLMMFSTPNVLDSFGFASMSGPTVVISYTDASVNINQFEYRGLFIFKERVWVVTNKGIYASKTGDPKVFTTPSGYFLRIRDEDINAATALNDTIYLFCPESIHALNFGTDPNLDASVRPISQSIGAESCTVYGNSVYAYTNDKILSVSGNSVDTLFEDFSSINRNANYEYNQDGYEGSKLTVWKDHLILVKYSNLSVGGVDSTDRSARCRVWWPVTGSNDYAAQNAMMFNLTNGFVSILDFRDQILGNTPAPTTYGRIADLSFNEYSGSLYLATTMQRTSTVNSTYLYQFSVDDLGHPLTAFDYDIIYLDYADLMYAEPYVSVEVHAYTPDGNEYLMKKFRSLQIQGNISHATVSIGLDYKPMVETKAISSAVDTYDGGPNVMLPYRVGVNARARAISVKIANYSITDWFTYTPGFNPPSEFKFVLDDIRLLWTYTGRGPINSSIDGTLPSL